MLDGHGDGLDSRRDIEFAKDTLDMKAHGPFSDAGDLRDFPIGFSVLHPVQNGDLPRR